MRLGFDTWEEATFHSGVVTETSRDARSKPCCSMVGRGKGSEDWLDGDAALLFIPLVHTEQANLHAGFSQPHLTCAPLSAPFLCRFLLSHFTDHDLCPRH